MRDHEYFVYIVCSRSGTLYIGMTNNIYHRALETSAEKLQALRVSINATGLSTMRVMRMFTKLSDAKTTEGLVESEEESFDRIEEPTVGRLRR
jgi:predicted GIY-YIG superfamily endonuclease